MRDTVMRCGEAQLDSRGPHLSRSFSVFFRRRGDVQRVALPSRVLRSRRYAPAAPARLSHV
jgi:hypothetical protein